jgi:hypothetical protein
MWWLLGLDQTRFRGNQNDFKVSANFKAADVKLDLMRVSKDLNESQVSVLLQTRPETFRTPCDFSQKMMFGDLKAV